VFRPVSAELDFCGSREAEIARWRTNDVFTRSMKHREGAEPWVFYEVRPRPMASPDFITCGPGSTGPLLPLPNNAGPLRRSSRRLDTHGLPVEVQVEKQLGISGRRAIVEQVGVEEFTRLCRESVLTSSRIRAAHRGIGYWTDMEHAYYTFHRPTSNRCGGTSTALRTRSVV